MTATCLSSWPAGRPACEHRRPASWPGLTRPPGQALVMAGLDPTLSSRTRRPPLTRSSGLAFGSARGLRFNRTDQIMALEQAIDLALARTIGAGGLPEVAIEAGLR